MTWAKGKDGSVSFGSPNDAATGGGARVEVGRLRGQLLGDGLPGSHRCGNREGRQDQQEDEHDADVQEQPDALDAGDRLQRRLGHGHHRHRRLDLLRGREGVVGLARFEQLGHHVAGGVGRQRPHAVQGVLLGLGVGFSVIALAFTRLRAVGTVAALLFTALSITSLSSLTLRRI